MSVRARPERPIDQTCSQYSLTCNFTTKPPEHKRAVLYQKSKRVHTRKHNVRASNEIRK